MELHLQRTYHAAGTNGIIKWNDQLLCYTIELPWKGNRRGISCIPEGRYSLEARSSPLLEDHLLVEKVPGRGGIFIHPANVALTELKGCIAPVSKLIGPGKGEHSRYACTLLQQIVYHAIQSGERVWLNIYSSNKISYETNKKEGNK